MENKEQYPQFMARCTPLPERYIMFSNPGIRGWFQRKLDWSPCLLKQAEGRVNREVKDGIICNITG